VFLVFSISNGKDILRDSKVERLLTAEDRVIPNAPAEAGGRGTLRGIAAPVQSRGAPADLLVPHTPLPASKHRTVPLGRDKRVRSG